MRIGSKPIVGRIQRVFIFQPAHPTRRIIEIDAMVIVTEKCTWAETPAGRRHLLGSSAFFTKAAAERAKRGALVKIVETRYLMTNVRTTDMWHRAQQQLEIFERKGTFDYQKRGKLN